MRLLGIETSCDDTAVAIVVDGRDVAANVVTNQDRFHERFGGIVPEIASRQHLALMTAAIDEALTRAALHFGELDGVAVTVGPGLIGSLVVGVATAKAVAYARALPLYGVNHLHGHLYAPFLERDLPARYPWLTVIVSGGHSQLVHVAAPGDFRILGKTFDDAAGEAFDKTARLLGLPFPGGAALDELARTGNARAIAFPRHTPKGDNLDMSFSGLKTAARRLIESSEAAAYRPEDIAASFQAAVVATLMDRVERAAHATDYAAVCLTGGVAANSALQHAVQDWGRRRNVPVYLPQPRYCTDNAAMIAAAAYHLGERLRVDPRDVTADPRLSFFLPL